MPDSTGIELKLENGMVIKGDNAEEALKNAAKIIEDNVKSYRETKAQLDQLSTQFNEFQQRQAQPPPKPQQSTDGFNNDKYFQLLNQDPVAANDYWFEHRFGQKPEQVAADFRGVQEKISVLDGQSLAAAFTNMHPDFPSDNESAQALTGRIKELQRMGHPTDLHTMDLAWNQLVNEGKLKPMEQTPEPQESLPPSMMGVGGMTSGVDMNKIDQMSDKDLYALLKSKGML